MQELARTHHEKRLDQATLAALCVFVVCVLAITMPREVYSGDANAIRASTVMLLTEGKLRIPVHYARSHGARGQYFVEHPNNGCWHPKYGVLNAFLYIPPLLGERLVTGDLKLEVSERGRSPRCLLLNVYNIALASLLAIYLYSIARLCTTRVWAAAIWVLFVFFGTFLWTYLRAQTVELFQVFFFTAAYYHVLKLAGPAMSCRAWRWHAAAMMAYAGLLCLSKLVFVVLLPLFGAVVWCTNGPANATGQASRLKTFCLSFCGPTATIVALLLTANWYRFGSPWATGYQQWEQERHLFTAGVGEGLLGYLIDPHKSVFIYFPALTLGLLRVRQMFAVSRLG